MSPNSEMKNADTTIGIILLYVVESNLDTA